MRGGPPSLPGGMDPDEVFRRQGAEELRRLVRTEAVDYLSHRIREAAGRKGGPDAGDTGGARGDPSRRLPLAVPADGGALRLRVSPRRIA